MLLIDPTKLFADLMVNFEMCEAGKIITMFKNNASLDYASIVDSTTRALLVIMVDSSEAREEIMKLRAAAECAQKVKAEYDEQVAKEEEEKKAQEEAEWQEFGGDGD